MFPLYDEIIKKMDGSETCLTKTHCTTINRLDQNHIDIIYLIILHHYSINKSGRNDLPYGSKTISNGKGITFRRINQIPDELQKIICRYLVDIAL